MFVMQREGEVERKRLERSIRCLLLSKKHEVRSHCQHDARVFVVAYLYLSHVQQKTRRQTTDFINMYGSQFALCRMQLYHISFIAFDVSLTMVHFGVDRNAIAQQNWHQFALCVDSFLSELFLKQQSICNLSKILIEL